MLYAPGQRRPRIIHYHLRPSCYHMVHEAEVVGTLLALELVEPNQVSPPKPRSRWTRRRSSRRSRYVLRPQGDTLLICFTEECVSCAVVFPASSSPSGGPTGTRASRGMNAQTRKLRTRRKAPPATLRHSRSSSGGPFPSACPACQGTSSSTSAPWPLHRGSPRHAGGELQTTLTTSRPVGTWTSFSPSPGDTPRNAILLLESRMVGRLSIL